MPYILSTSFCPRVTDISFIDRNSFLDLILTSFRNIKSADKKHWHHRPIYRVSPAHILSNLDCLFTRSSKVGYPWCQTGNGQHCGGSNQSQGCRKYLEDRIWEVPPPSVAFLTFADRVDILCMRTNMWCITSISWRFWRIGIRFDLSPRKFEKPLLP